MRRLMAIAAAATLISAPAIAQTRVVSQPVTTGSIFVTPADLSVPGSATASPHARTQGNNAHTGSELVPFFQQGSNQEAGGPANELNASR